MAASQIGKRAWSYAGVLQDDGLSCFEYVEKLTLLLVLKMADHLTENSYNRAPLVPPDLGGAATARRRGVGGPLPKEPGKARCKAVAGTGARVVAVDVERKPFVMPTCQPPQARTAHSKAMRRGSPNCASKMDAEMERHLSATADPPSQTWS
jgi:hypothetical protein